MATTRTNPCKYRYAGCSATVRKGERCCKSCRATHNAREAERRRARREACRCVVCGADAVKVAGVALSTCAMHREYYNARQSALP